MPVGRLLQDEKMPGVHPSLGHPFGALTGASWTSSIEAPLLIHQPDVMLDGEPVMLRGRYAPEVMG